MTDTARKPKTEPTTPAEQKRAAIVEELARITELLENLEPLQALHAPTEPEPEQ